MSGGFTPSLKRTTDQATQEASFLASERIGVKRVGVTIDANTVPADADGNKIVKAGTFLAEITATGKYGPYGGLTNEVQTVTVTGGPTGGTFTLTFGGVATSAIAYNASAADVEAALEALPNLDPEDVSVSGSAGGPWTVTFSGEYSGTDVPALALGTNSLTGGTTPSVSVTTTTAGGAAVADGREAPSADTSGYALESVNLKDGDVICGLLIHGSVLEARVTPAPDATTRTAVKGRIIFQ